MNTEEIISGQWQRLNNLHRISKKPILIKMKEGATPEGADYDEYNWVEWQAHWKKVKVPIYTRTILTSEVCFDPDVKNWNILKEELTKLYDYSKDNNIPLQLAYSGGAGIHGHLFLNSFELDEDVIKKASLYDIDISKIVRDTVMDLLLKDAGASRQRLEIDNGKVTFDKNGKGSMIREFGTTRPDGGYKTLITSIPDSKEEARKLPLVFPGPIELWTIPDGYIGAINEALKEAIKKAEDKKEYNINDMRLEGNELKSFPCMAHLLKNGARSRYYGAVAITLLSKRCGLSQVITEGHINKFFDKCDITDDERILRINNVKTLDSSHHNFSCRKVKEHFGDDICKFEKCVFFPKVIKAKAIAAEKESNTTPEHIKKLADEKMKDGAAGEFILDNHQKMHKGDRNLAKTLMVSVGIQSVKNSAGIQAKASGRPGGGKTHCFKTMAHLIPQKYIVKSTFSDKGLYYRKIPTGAIIFSDDVNLSEDLEGVIKRANSNFQDGDTYTTVKDHGTVELTIPPRVSFWLTSVDDNQSAQLLSRQFCGNIDESETQDSEVTDFQLEQAYLGTEELPLTDDVLVCREIFRRIKEQLFIVQIPFSKNLEWKDKSNHRNLSIFLDIIKAFTVLNYKNRITHEGSLIAHVDDYTAAKELYDDKAETQTTKKNEGELKVLKFIHRKQGKTKDPVNIDVIHTGLNLSRGRVHQILHGMKDKPDSGLLAKEPSLHYEKRSVKIGETTTTKGFYWIDEHFELLDSYSGVVNLKSEVVKHCKRCYSTVNPLLIYENDKLLSTVSTVIEKERENNKNNGSNGKNDKKNLSLTKTQKKPNSANSGSTDNENTVNSGGDSALTALTVQKSPLELGKETMKYLSTWKRPENIEAARELAIDHLRKFDRSQDDKFLGVIVDGAFQTMRWIP